VRGPLKGLSQEPTGGGEFVTSVAPGPRLGLSAFSYKKPQKEKRAQRSGEIGEVRVRKEIECLRDQEPWFYGSGKEDGQNEEQMKKTAK